MKIFTQVSRAIREVIAITLVLSVMPVVLFAGWLIGLKRSEK